MCLNRPFSTSNPFANPLMRFFYMSKIPVAPKTVATKKFHVDFFQLVFDGINGEIQSPYAGFVAVKDGVINSIDKNGDYSRELWNLEKKIPARSIRGELRKFRTSDLPEIGSMGQKAEQLELEDGQGIIERNFFVYYEKHHILAWHRNGHGSTARQFAKTLSKLFNASVQALPVVKTDAIERLLRGEIELKRIEVSLPKPTNPELYDSNDFCKTTLNMMSESYADSMMLSLNIDSRKPGSEGRLSSKMKRVIAEFVDLGATKARAHADGVMEPIDLITDRVSSTQEVETNVRYPTSASMFAMLDRARDECSEDIEAYFGVTDDVAS